MTRTTLEWGTLRKALGAAGLLLSAVMIAHCSSSSGGANGTPPACECSDGSACPAGDSAHCPGTANDAGGAAPDAASTSADSDASTIGPNGPYCVLYDIVEEFYATPMPQCSCQTTWKNIDDAQYYVAVLDYYPGIYANAHVVASCPVEACCVHEPADDGGASTNCLCSAVQADCTNARNQGATPATSCP